MNGSQVGSVVFQTGHRPPWTQVESKALDAQLHAAPYHDATDVFTNASSQPPGYYAVGAVATAITGGDALDRCWSCGCCRR